MSSTQEAPRLATLLKNERGIRFAHSTDIVGLNGDPWYAWAFWGELHRQFNYKRSKFGFEVMGWKPILFNEHHRTMMQNKGDVIGFHGQLINGTSKKFDPFNRAKIALDNMQINLMDPRQYFDVVDHAKVAACDLSICSVDQLIEISKSFAQKTMYINLHNKAARSIPNPKEVAAALAELRKTGITIFLLVENDANEKSLEETIDTVKRLQDAGILAGFLYDSVHHLREKGRLELFTTQDWVMMLQVIQKYIPQVAHIPMGTLAYDSLPMDKITTDMWEDFGSVLQTCSVFPTVEFQTNAQLWNDPNANSSHEVDNDIIKAGKKAVAILQRHIVRTA